MSSRCIGLPVGEVGVDLLAGGALIAGELERKRREPAGHELARLADRDPGPALTPGATSHGERRLMQAELLEGESLPRGLGLGGRVGEVRGAQRVGLGAQPAARREV